MTSIECVAFMLVKGETILAEKRKPTKKVVPGAVALPEGHMEYRESPEDALHRELYEELGIATQNIKYVCTLLHIAQECRKLHYFVIKSWRGDIQNHEAEALLWIPVDALEDFDLDVDRVAICEFLRVYGL